jgi:hypothetical protein
MSAYKEKPRNPQLIKSVRDIQKKNNALLKTLLPEGLDLKAEDYVALVTRAKDLYDAQNQLTNRGKIGRWSDFKFFSSSRVGIENAEDLLKSLEGKNFAEIELLITTHLSTGKGRNAETSFKTILKQELEACAPHIEWMPKKKWGLPKLHVSL